MAAQASYMELPVSPSRLDATFPPRSFALTWLRGLCVACCCLVVGGCASGGGGGMVAKTLQAVGIRDNPAEVPAGEQTVELRLFPGENLNAGASGRPLALVVRVYHLRGTQRFEQAPFDAFLDESRERSALGDDLVRVNEVVLVPGKPHQLREVLSGDATALGVVALFMAPARQRWRFAFDPRHKSVGDGITVGLHACAMTTTSPALSTPLGDDPASLVSARCVPAR